VDLKGGCVSKGLREGETLKQDLARLLFDLF